MKWRRSWGGILGLAVLAAAWLAAVEPIAPSPSFPSFWRVSVEHESPPAEPVVPVPPVPSPTEEKKPFTLEAPGRPSDGSIRIALIIDDMGMVDQDDVFAALSPEVTLSYLPYAPNLGEQVRRAMERGHEIMLHLPMEPSGRENPGPDALLTGLTTEEIAARTRKALGAFDGYVGVNNHMGSEFTKHPEGMRIVAQILHERGLFFVDSRTAADSVAGTVAREEGVRVAWRDVFLDDAADEDAIRDELSKLERIAKTRGMAVAIGHPRPLTLAVLERWIPEILGKGIQIVPVSEIVE